MQTLIKVILWIAGLILLAACWPLVIIIVIFLGLMKIGMKKDFEP